MSLGKRKEPDSESKEGTDIVGKDNGAMLDFDAIIAETTAKIEEEKKKTKKQIEKEANEEQIQAKKRRKALAKEIKEDMEREKVEEANALKNEVNELEALFLDSLKKKK